MIQYYFQQINHNRYLKMLYKTPYQISNIDRISMFIQFDTQLNNKFIVLCSFFLFKTTLFKTGHYIVINKKTKQILGLNYYFTKQLIINFFNIFLLNLLIQPEIQNSINLTSFDSDANFNFTIINSNCYFFERILINQFYKRALQSCNFHITIKFKKNQNIYDHILLLNFFKFYFS